MKVDFKLGFEIVLMSFNVLLVQVLTFAEFMPTYTMVGMKDIAAHLKPRYRKSEQAHGVRGIDSV